METVTEFRQTVKKPDLIPFFVGEDEYSIKGYCSVLLNRKYNEDSLAVNPVTERPGDSGDISTAVACPPD